MQSKTVIDLNFQYAHEDKIWDERGSVDVDQALVAFRTFPWDGQLAQAMEFQICSPSLILEDTGDGARFFAGIMLEEPLNFMLYFERTEEVEGWSLLGKQMKRKQIIDDSYGHDRADAERAIRAFFEDRYALLKLIRARS